ncbi:MAG TPA: PilZ domain-containing protein [Candidatus Acidoferrum sp.]|nr:PilZ domain-containing protein [Candidatus Acidoferrum sp.]
MSRKDFLLDTFSGIRRGARAHCVREITVSREGDDELIRIKAPDLSITGMFITAAGTFPEGTVLNLKFRLAATGVEVRTRCEVRYCHPGIGIGVEFIGLSSEAAGAIERELSLSGERSLRGKKSPVRSRSPRRR